jgi:hypothetical protein
MPFAKIAQGYSTTELSFRPEDIHLIDKHIL